MFATKFCAIFGFFLLSVAFSSGEICQSPEVSSSFYSTSDSQLASESVLVVEFSLKCANDVKDVNLHAEVNGKTLPVTKTVDTDKYQVSISDEHKKLPKGLYKIRIFDDEQYSELRKVQRTGDDASSVTSLHTFEVHHQGVSRGPWIQTEHLAAAGVGLVCYLAYNARSQLQS